MVGIETRIRSAFEALRSCGELGMVAYSTAGDPSVEATLKFVLALAEAGADVIELGVPFSDPLADGPTIQRASERALKSGTTLSRVIDLVHRIRLSSQVPLVLFSYYNPILQMGLEKFASAAANAGADGVLATDLTPEESEDYRRILAAHHLDTRLDVDAEPQDEPREPILVSRHRTLTEDLAAVADSTPRCPSIRPIDPDILHRGASLRGLIYRPTLSLLGGPPS